ncbi:nucleic acid-binding protein [Sporanaerobium hydrogeniformans]|uniref:Nucleic acid-binding protein n=1 Tax=Sporanaerobium hydrogeniformans TaxID=3072179 RepID=A0AC61DFV4_9FIRM|nr:YlxR family protein [Sporanaerobium hydrogeniformans]PHV71780.1 nucleic acid-binding protein [Sporanaerobium hydrogeniformans]
MKQRKIPLRKCTGCNEMKNKKEMIRVVRNNEGEFSLDFNGKKPGRGAYICKNVECLNHAEKNKGLERSFKTPVDKEIYNTLREEFKQYDGQ